MARFNEILVGRYNRLVQKLFSMKGPASLVTIADEMMGVFPFINGVENRYLEDWALFGIPLGVGPVALNQSALRLRNPANSNVVAIFSKLSVLVGAAMTVRGYLGTIATNLATTVAIPNSRFDARSRPAPTLLASIDASVVSQPTFGSQFMEVTVNAFSPYELIVHENQEIPLLPGDGIEFIGISVNTSITGNFWWRERFLEDSERA